MEHLIGPIIAGAVAAVATVSVIWNKLATIQVEMADKLATIQVEMAAMQVTVSRLENVLNGNGDGLPIRCVKHSAKLDDCDRRLKAVERGPRIDGAKL